MSVPASAVAAMNLTSLQPTRSIINIGFQLIGKVPTLRADDLDFSTLRIVTAIRKSALNGYEFLGTQSFQMETEPIHEIVETEKRDWSTYKNSDGKVFKCIDFDNKGLFDLLDEFLLDACKLEKEEICLLARARLHSSSSVYHPVLISSTKESLKFVAPPISFGRNTPQYREYMIKMAQTEDGWGKLVKPSRLTMQRNFVVEPLAMEWQDFMKSPAAKKYILSDLEITYFEASGGKKEYQPSRSIYFLIQSLYASLRGESPDKVNVKAAMNNLYEIIEKSRLASLSSFVMRLLNKMSSHISREAVEVLMENYEKFFLGQQFAFLTLPAHVLDFVGSEQKED